MNASAHMYDEYDGIEHAVTCQYIPHPVVVLLLLLLLLLCTSGAYPRRFEINRFNNHQGTSLWWLAVIIIISMSLSLPYSSRCTCQRSGTPTPWPTAQWKWKIYPG